MNRLAHKTAIVTGGAVGIGRVCVERMAEEGAQVANFDVMETEGQARASELSGKGHAVAFRRVDVADETAMKAAIDAAAAQFGGLHVMVNNAGISGSPSAIWANPMTSPGRWSGSRPMRRSSSPGPRLPSTGAIQRADAND